MVLRTGQSRIATNPQLAPGWRLQRTTPPSRLYGANGLRTGSDGRIYVAQVAGSQVSAIDIDTGAIETISPNGGPIIAPDDLAFDELGNLYATELTLGRVSVYEANGNYRVLQDNMPCANPITFHQGRLIAGECRPGGRIMELDRNGGIKRIILDNVPMPNAFEVGPDGLLYFPVMGANEIWRVNPAGGSAEIVATGLGVPDSVKFDSKGFIVSTQVATGEVLRIDPRTGDNELLARLAPGLDNCTFVNDRLFASNMTGEITEIRADGVVEPLLPGGFQWPMGLATNAAGTLCIADGAFLYTIQSNGTPECVGMLFSPGYPGFARGVGRLNNDEWLITTSNGDVARYAPSRQRSDILASGYDQLMGVCGTPQGGAITAEYGAGRILMADREAVTVLANGLDKPVGVTISGEGICYASESGAGRIIKITGGKTQTVLDGLGQPEGIAMEGSCLYIADVERHELVQFDTATGRSITIAAGLPIGAPNGAQRVQLGAVGNLSGPMTAFTGVAVSDQGVVYVAADGEGSVLSLRAH